MAYPFGRPIPFVAFIHRLCSQYGCEQHVSRQGRQPIDMADGSRVGELQRFRYLLRRTGVVRVAALPEHDPAHDEALRSTIRSICTRLGIDPGEFGILSEPDTDDQDDD